MKSILSVRNLTKSFQTGSKELVVLNNISIEIESGSSCAIVGPSGSGKTTLLGLCAGLDLPSSGTVVLDDVDLNDLTEDERARFRNDHVGFVFQNFQLMPTLTAIENVMVPLELRGDKDVESKAKELLSGVGLGDRLGHYPIQLSGGEQQRVALARAFINQPKILFADEPTGNLDFETSELVSQLLFKLNQTHHTTLIIATHNLELAHKTHRILNLKGGVLVGDGKLSNPRRERELIA